jgi:hypothetical protein
VAIQIDVHHTGENPTSMPHAFHTRSAYDPRPYVSHVVHVHQPFMKSSTELGRVTASEKNEFLTTSLARRLADLRVPIQFLSPSQP